MKVAVAGEVDAGEPRVAATPETVKKMIALGADVAVEPGAGVKSEILDADYSAAGATVTKDAVNGADIVLKVRRPLASELSHYKRGAIIVIMDPHGHDDALRAVADAGVSTSPWSCCRASPAPKSMDVLSSQANLAGYRAVIDAAAAFQRGFPMMMTAAGTVPAAHVFVIGAGVAGLQAIATARRLGAIVSATDVRPAAKEQVKSRRQLRRRRGRGIQSSRNRRRLAKEMSKEYQAKQAALVADHIKKQDIVITTALIPGRPGAAPRFQGYGDIDAARLGDRRPRRRARRQCRRRQGRRRGRCRRRQDRRLQTTRSICCGLGSRTKLNTIDLNSVDW